MKIMTEKKIITYSVKDFHLDHIFDCGQCFRWNRQADGSYVGIAGGRVARMSFQPGVLTEESSSQMVVRHDSTKFDTEGLQTTEGLPVTEGSPLTEGLPVTEGLTTTEGPPITEGLLTIEGTVLRKPARREPAAADEMEPEAQSEEEFCSFWYDYLDLGRDYGKIKRSLGRGDAAMRRAIRAGAGIRILKQDLWETMISFIISQNNNIPRIKACIESLCREFGEPVPVPDGLLDGEPDHDTIRHGSTLNTAVPATASLVPATAAALDPAMAEMAAAAGDTIRKDSTWFDIPRPEVLASLSRSDLDPCRLGYRAPYLIETARQVLARGGVEAVEKELRQAGDVISALTDFAGVGPKVASCIALFGVGRTDAFPIDVWMRRAMHTVYGIEENRVREMQEYAAKYFGQYGGLAQQYLFYYIRGL